MMKQMIEEPTIGQILATERKLRGDRLELFQGAFDVLHDKKQAKDNPEIAWRLSNLPYLFRGFERVNRESRDNCARPAGVLYAQVKTPKDSIDLGLVSVNVVTTAGVNYVIDSLQALATINNLKWHASGTNNTAENASQTALSAETGSRVSGTQTEGASANIYKTVATITYGSSLSIVEHGLFSGSTPGRYSIEAYLPG